MSISNPTLIVGTASQVLANTLAAVPQAGLVTLTLPQAIDTSSNPSFNTVTSTVLTGTAPFTVTSTTQVANLSIGGTATYSNNTLITDATANTAYPLLLAPTLLPGQQSLLMDSDITYNPVTNALQMESYGSISIGTLTYVPPNSFVNLQSATNTYVQAIMQNSNGGIASSADFIVNNELSTDTTYYGDFGMTSAVFADTINIRNTPNTVYLQTANADLAIGTLNSNPIRFVVNQGAIDAFTIGTAGQWGIAGSNGITGQVFTSGGASAAPSWTSLSGVSVTSFSGDVTGLTPATPTTGAITLGGTLNVAHGGTGSPSAPTSGQFLYSSGGTTYAPTTLSSQAVTTLNFGTTGLTPSTATSGAITVAGTLVAVNGGTGQSTYAIGDILYASTTTALSRLADVAAGRYLRSGGTTTAPLWSTTILPNSATTGDLLFASAANTYTNLADVATGNALISGGVTTAPAWGKIGLTTHISGTLAVGNGGTGQVTAAAAFSALSPITTTGDIIYSSTGTTNSRLGIGTAGQVLTVVSGVPAWTTAASSGVTSITGTSNQITASASTGAVTLSVPSTFVAPGYIKDTTGLYLSTTNTISAAGTTQGTATALTTSNNVVTSVAANSGVILPIPALSGLFISIVNNGANTLNVYPSSGVTIDSGAADIPATIPSNGEAIYAASSTTSWNTIRPAVVAGNGITLSNGIGTQTFTGANTGTILQQVNGPVSISTSTTATYAPVNLAGVVIAAVGTIAGVVISGTGGTFTCTAFVPGFYIGQAITISGTFGGTGSITGYTNPKTYYVIATTANTNFTLSATLGGAAITTTAGTPTGLTYTPINSGYFTCTALAAGLAVGQPILITGTFGGTGSITGYVNPTTYYVIATTATTNFTLSATPGGTAITTTTGTPTGLTYSPSPASTVGTQIWTQSFTPTSTTSKIWVQFALTMAASATNIGGYCFVYAGGTCINVTCTPLGAGTNPGTVTVYNYYQSGSLTPITFSARVAGSAAGTLFINEASATATLGGAMISRFTITEVT